jgi:hypothetical protein
VQRDWLFKECPRHRVYVQAFRMMRYPVTNYEYHRFLADTDYSSLPTSWRFGRYPLELANHPVWSVSEAAASMYASWLSQQLGRRFQLPIEAEWEYAACGGRQLHQVRRPGPLPSPARVVRKTTAIRRRISIGRVRQLADDWRMSITSPTRRVSSMSTPAVAASRNHARWRCPEVFCLRTHFGRATKRAGEP